MAIKSCFGLVAVVLALVVDTGSSWAGEQLPYKDRVEAVITGATFGEGLVTLPFEVVRGQGTHVGRFTTLGELIVDLSDFSFIGINTLTAANGDQIFIYIEGGLTETEDPTVFEIAVETTFLGGTGKFKDCTGGFDGLGELHLAEGSGFVGATFSGDGVGTISLAKPKKK